MDEADNGASTGGHEPGDAPSMTADVAQRPPRPVERAIPVVFSGEGSEFFRIWIVNTLLTIVTLGVYLAWAKVRTRRYFYWNTYLDGHAFDYLAAPRAILIGHLILFGALFSTNVITRVHAVVGTVLTLAFWTLLPWFIYKAHRFKARYSSYRGIKFRFLGTAGGAYKVYFLPVLAVLGIMVALQFAIASGAGNGAEAAIGLIFFFFMIALALAMPLWIYHQKRYTFDNLAFGSAPGLFTPSLKYFYTTFLKAFLLAVLLFGVTTFLFGVIGIGLGSITPSPEKDGGFPFGGFALILLIDFIMLVAFIFVQQFVYAKLMNHCWSNLRIGPVTFQCEISAMELALIRITNVVGIVATLGIFTPWARVRRIRYMASCFQVVTSKDLGEFTAAADSEVAALGEAAAEYFDLDIGW